MAVIDDGGNDNYEYLDGMRRVHKVLKSKPSLPPLVVKETNNMDTTNWKYQLGDNVRKIKGSDWEGFVVGFYKSSHTPCGYAVESSYHYGSVQIYPENALEKI